jgi:hypothetical protein
METPRADHESPSVGPQSPAGLLRGLWRLSLGSCPVIVPGVPGCLEVVSGSRIHVALCSPLVYACMFICVYVCMYVCMHVFLAVRWCMRVSSYVCIYVCMYACAPGSPLLYACMFICMYVCMFVCMYVLLAVRCCVHVCVCRRLIPVHV